MCAAGIRLCGQFSAVEVQAEDPEYDGPRAAVGRPADLGLVPASNLAGFTLAPLVGGLSGPGPR